MAVCGVAGRLLSAEAGAAARAGVCGFAISDGGDQWHVLLAAEAAVFSGLECADAQGFRVRREGLAVPDAHAEAQKRGEAAGELLCERVAGTWKETRADFVAVSAAAAV